MNVERWGLAACLFVVVVLQVQMVVLWLEVRRLRRAQVQAERQ